MTINSVHNVGKCGGRGVLTVIQYTDSTWGLLRLLCLDIQTGRSLGKQAVIQSRTFTFFFTYTGFYDIAEKPKLPVATALMVVPTSGRMKLALAPAPRTCFLGSFIPVQRLMFSYDWDQKYISADLVYIFKPHSIKKNNKPVSGPFKQTFFVFKL